MYKFNSHKTSHKHTQEGGQGITEYILILALVGVAVVLIVNVMQPVISNVFADLVNEAPVAPPALLAFTPPATSEPVTLTTAVNGSGSITVNPDQSQYTLGESVQLQAVPTSGWVFIGWSGDLNDISDSALLVMDSDKSVTAHFVEGLYTLTLSTSGNGTTSSIPPVLTDLGQGQQVEISANPDTNWAFVEWQGDYTGSDNPGTVTITGDMAVTAVFTDTLHQLNVTAAGNGSVTKNPNLTDYPNGSTVTLTALADPGWFFNGWSGGGLSGSNPVANLTMDSDKNVTAVFTEVPANEYSLTIIVDGNGTVTKTPDNPTYVSGTSVDLEAFADLGHLFTGWSGDLTGGVSPTTIIMDSHKTITATFDASAYTVDITILGNGTVTKNPDQTTYNYNDVVTLTATEDPGWVWAGWSDDLTGTTNPVNITITGSQAITANFTEIPCNLPSPWQSGDIGAVSAAGEACEDTGTFTVSGSGNDIWNSTDEFHYMNQSFNGDGEIIARVVTQTNTDSWAKAGVMIRESLAANAAYAFAAVTPSNGIQYQYRASTSANASGAGGTSGTVPVWLKLERLGDTFTAYQSSDGSNWTLIGTQIINMGSTVYYGLAVTSHNDGVLSTGEFTNVAINPITTPFRMETVTMNDVNSSTWRRVTLQNTYTDMVAVCSVNYNNNNSPEVVRMRNAAGNSFEIQLQNPSGSTLVSESVHCLVVEAGAWNLPDGTKIEAQKYTSTVTDRKGNWVGQSQSYLQSYSQPIVLGQVMTTFDTSWSVFWSNDGGQTSPPSASNLFTGKHVGEDSDTTRANETIGFIAVEANNGTISGSIAYEADITNDFVRGIDNSPPYTHNFNTSFSSAPQVVIVTQAAMDGGDGGWAYLFNGGSITASSIGLAVDEDQIGDSERAHTTEQFFYLAISQNIVLP